MPYVKILGFRYLDVHNRDLLDSYDISTKYLNQGIQMDYGGTKVTPSLIIACGFIE